MSEYISDAELYQDEIGDIVSAIQKAGYQCEYQHTDEWDVAAHTFTITTPIKERKDA
tara:strand:+ start:3073 stop:3243 length:171 start_codon:yes stop_codon:yes gene_type:complete